MELPLSIEKCVALVAQCFTLATSSKSKRRACGALLVCVREDGVPVVISSGINGTAPGADNACEPPCLTYTFGHVVHAEPNCLANFDSDFVFTDRHILFVSDSPCPHCFKIIAERGIKHVVFGRGYRIQDHLTDEVLALHCMTLTQVDMQAVIQYLSNTVTRIEQVIC